MARLSTIAWGAERFRFGPWRADGKVAYLAAFSTHPTVAAVTAAVDRLRSEGYQRVVTSAMRPHEAPAFLATGFVERERLVVLQRRVERDEPASPLLIRRCRKADMAAVLAVDHAAFDPPWQLDRSGIGEALRATPRSQLRVAGERGQVIGYAICGRAGRTGYLQRLAVDPRGQGHGVGRALVQDSLRWLSRGRARGVLVNTQETNRRAIELYLSMDFRYDRSELLVLERGL